MTLYDLSNAHQTVIDNPDEAKIRSLSIINRFHIKSNQIMSPKLRRNKPKISISHVSVELMKTSLKPITIVASIITSQGGKARRLLELITKPSRMWEIKGDLQ